MSTFSEETGIRYELQQLLPFTVLKPFQDIKYQVSKLPVATALTVYGIETKSHNGYDSFDHPVATALTVYGIETFFLHL